MTILNIIYMFDDCRSVLTCSPTHSLIKLHAFFFLYSLQAADKESKQMRVREQDKKNELKKNSPLPFSLRITFYRFIWNALLRAHWNEWTVNGHFSSVARNNTHHITFHWKWKNSKVVVEQLAVIWVFWQNEHSKNLFLSSEKQRTLHAARNEHLLQL